ncbi:MAG: hypothetical protein WC497_06175 [Patescibacteria group bacterium]
MKIIPVNGKNERAYAIVRNSESITCDYSALMKKGNAQAQRDVFDIYFRNRMFTFPLYSQPAGTVLTLDNIARVDYKMQPMSLEWSGDPEMKKKDFEKLLHAAAPQFNFDNFLEWSRVVLLLPNEKIIKEREEVVELPDKSKVRVKVPKGKTLMIEGAEGGPSPMRALLKDEQDFVDRLEASERRVVLSVQKPAEKAKPAVTFSSDFLVVNCDVWKKSESRKRARQANTVLRKLYENYEHGNKPMSVEKILKNISTERIDKLLDKTRYPQTFNLICQKTNEQTGEQKIWLSDNYKYHAE